MYDLLRLSPEVASDRLRYVYEEHVADAARRQDHRRLLELSTAFDALPQPVRQAMYPKVWSASTGRDRLPLSLPVADRPLAAQPLRPPRRRRARQPAQPAGPADCGLRQPVSRRAVVGALVITFLLGAIQFLHATHLLHDHATAARLVAPVRPAQTVDVRAIADELNRADSRDDIACQQASSATPTQLICQASGGEAWAVNVYAPPTGYTATIIRRSTYEQSAYFDAWAAVGAVKQCRQVGGALPPSALNQVGQARIVCGGGVMTQYLRPGNQLDYQRINPAMYKISVTASDGEIVTFDSATNKFTPQQ